MGGNGKVEDIEYCRIDKLWYNIDKGGRNTDRCRFEIFFCYHGEQRVQQQNKNKKVGNMKQITKKRLISYPIIAVILVVAVLGIVGGAYAFVASNHLTSSGSIVVNGLTTQYGLDKEVMVFHPSEAYKSGNRIVLTCDPITVTNSGDQPVTSFSIEGVTTPGFGTLLLDTTSGLPLFSGQTTTITLTFDGVAPGQALNSSSSYDLSFSLACDLVPEYASLTFTTGLASDGVALGGSLATGFNFVRGGTSMHILTLDGATSTPVDLADGSYAFTLQADTTQQATLTSYFTAKDGWTTDMLSQINSEISGVTPFFFLKADGGSYSLVDNFKKVALGYDDASAVLTIDDDYPAGTYIYTGTLTGSNGAIQVIQVTLIVP